MSRDAERLSLFGFRTEPIRILATAKYRKCPKVDPVALLRLAGFSPEGFKTASNKRSTVGFATGRRIGDGWSEEAKFEVRHGRLDLSGTSDATGPAYRGYHPSSKPTQKSGRHQSRRLESTTLLGLGQLTRRLPYREK